MHKKLTVLLIEDNPGDARLIREFLATSGGSFHVEVADRLSTGLARLEVQQVDAVLLDLSLPDSHGLDTFARLYAQAPRMPIVVLTGLDDEVLAEEAVRAGAQDYLVKGQVDGNLLTRSIRYAVERKQAEETLLESELKFRTLFDHARDGILIADMETHQFFMGNSAICQMLGYTHDELSGIGIDEIHPLEHLPYVIEQFNRQARGEIDLAKDIPVKRKDGSVFYADINSTPVTLSEQTCIMGIFRDITVRKRAEEEIKKQLDELQRWHNATLGRETRILDLKREVNELLGKAGQPPRYASAET